MARKKSRKSKPEALSKVLESLLQSNKSPLSEQFIKWRVWNSWSEIVGDQVAKYTMPVSFLNGELYIWVTHPTRMQDLRFCAGSMIGQINRFCNKRWVRRIRFTLDKKSVPMPDEASEQFRGFISRSGKNDVEA